LGGGRTDWKHKKKIGRQLPLHHDRNANAGTLRQPASVSVCLHRPYSFFDWFLGWRYAEY